MQTETKCLFCGFKFKVLDATLDFSLNITQFNNVDDAFIDFFKSEILTGENAIKCNRYIVLF